MTATQHIRELFQGLQNGTAFFLSDVVEDTSMVFGIERSAARNLAQQVIVKMLEDGELERADRGVYYKTSGQGVGESFDQDRILRCYLFDVHGHRIGYEDGARLAYEIGILPEKPAFRGIVTNRMVNGYQPALAKRLGVLLGKPNRILVDDDNADYLQLLDAVSLMPSFDGAASPRIDFQSACQIIRYVEDRGLDLARLAGYATKAYTVNMLKVVGTICAVRIDPDEYRQCNAYYKAGPDRN